MLAGISSPCAARLRAADRARVSDAVDGLWAKHIELLAKIRRRTTDPLSVYGHEHPLKGRQTTTTRVKDEIWNREMASEQVVQRMVSAETGIDAQRLRLGNLGESEWPLFVQATGRLSDLPLFIDDTPSLSVLQMRTKARRLHAEHGIDLILVDYLQLIKPRERMDMREREVADISRRLKALARTLSIPVICLAQLNRQCEMRSDNRPRLYWTFLAAQSLGAIPVPVYQDAVADEMAYVLKHAKVKFVLAEDQEQVDKVLAISDGVKGIKEIIFDDERGLRDYGHGHIRSFEDAQELGRSLIEKDAGEGWLKEIAKGKGSDISVVPDV